MALMGGFNERERITHELRRLEEKVNAYDYIVERLGLASMTVEGVRTEIEKHGISLGVDWIPVMGERVFWNGRDANVTGFLPDGQVTIEFSIIVDDQPARGVMSMFSRYLRPASGDKTVAEFTKAVNAAVPSMISRDEADAAIKNFDRRSYSPVDSPEFKAFLAEGEKR